MENKCSNLEALRDYYFNLYNYYLAIGVQGEELEEALKEFCKYNNLIKNT